MDIRALLLGEEAWDFLWIIPLRALIIFSAVIIMLRLVGKRAIPQGIFEVLIIVIIGSAAGDPLIYNNVGILPAIIAFGIVVVLYKILSFVVGINRKAEHLVEDKCVKLLSDGQFEIQNFSEKVLMKDEIFADLRLKNVSQLGQVRAAYIEATGKISIFFCEDEQVRPGLPILPDLLDKMSTTIDIDGDYACCFCGNVTRLYIRQSEACSRCGKNQWVGAANERRVQ